MTTTNVLPLEDLFADARKYHDDFQVDHWILTKGHATPYGAYKQAVRELWSRAAALASEVIDLEEIEASEAECKFERARQALRALALRRTIDGRCRELKRFWVHATRLKQRLGDITPERRADLERADWVARVEQRYAIDMMRHNAPEPSTIQSLAALDAEDAQAIIESVSRQSSSLLAVIARPAREVRHVVGSLPPTDRIDIDNGEIIRSVKECLIPSTLALPDFSDSKHSTLQRYGVSR